MVVVVQENVLAVVGGAGRVIVGVGRERTAPGRVVGVVAGGAGAGLGLGARPDPPLFPFAGVEGGMISGPGLAKSVSSMVLATSVMYAFQVGAAKVPP